MAREQPLRDAGRDVSLLVQEVRMHGLRITVVSWLPTEIEVRINYPPQQSGEPKAESG